LREYRLAPRGGLAGAPGHGGGHPARFGGLQLYDELIAEHDSSPKLWNERGVCLHQTGRRDETAESYERAVQADPRYALAWNNLGVIRDQLGRADDALEAWLRALTVQPDLVAARLNLALALFQRHRLQLALEAYRHVLAGIVCRGLEWSRAVLVGER
jgi:tetratricopeptide (TPR) repeat protein